MNIAVCDDSPEQSALIQAAALDYFTRQDVEMLKISVYNNPTIFLESLKSCGGFDIILLDICMPGISGTSVAKEIRRRKDKSEIIFITNSDEFAVDAFALKAAHYLLKPFSQVEFDEAMDRAMVRFLDGSAKKIILKSQGGGIQSVEINDIYYIESFGHLLNIYLETDVFTESRRSLSRIQEMLEELSTGQFDSPCKGYLVNLNKVRTIEPRRAILINDKEIPVSRGSFRGFEESYFNYMFPDGGFQ